MTQPNELKYDFAMEAANGLITTTTKVWNMLKASFEGNRELVNDLFDDSKELIYAQYNYTPPIHFAVRDGHLELVKFLLRNGAYDPSYKTYPFQERLSTIAKDRAYFEIAKLLDDFEQQPLRHRYQGENGKIFFPRTDLELEFQQAVADGDLVQTETILEKNPVFALDETYFWGEGILTFAAKTNNRNMMDLLLRFGARVPSILKWAPNYYFENPDAVPYLMEKGMNPNTRSWQEVTILHDMARLGNIPNAELLIRYGANYNPIDDEYQSTPLGLAAKWGNTDMVQWLIAKGADINKAGAVWATPLQWAIKKQHKEIVKILEQRGAR